MLCFGVEEYVFGNFKSHGRISSLSTRGVVSNDKKTGGVMLQECIVDYVVFSGIDASCGGIILLCLGAVVVKPTLGGFGRASSSIYF